MESPEINQADQSAGHIEFTTREQNRDLVCDMALQARQSIQLFTAKLDNSLYDQSGFIEAVSVLAKRSPKSRIQILVRDTSALLKKGHRLIELSRRLTSAIQIHNPSVEDCQQIMELMLVDQKGYIHKNHADYYHGEASFNNRRITHQWQSQFERMWEVSTPDPEIRRLHI